MAGRPSRPRCAPVIPLLVATWAVKFLAFVVG